MSIINPERVPVKVYQWDDKDAPRIGNEPNCFLTLFKACLVTGYGDKTGAGWTIASEDMQAGVLVLRPPASAQQDFYLRLSGNNSEPYRVVAQVKLSPDESSAVLLNSSGKTHNFVWFWEQKKWTLLASSRGIWFFSEQKKYKSQTDIDLQKLGVYFYCGDTVGNTRGERAVWLGFTSLENTSYNQNFGIFDQNNKFSQVFVPSQQKSYNVHPFGLFNGEQTLSGQTLLSQICLSAAGEMYFLPAYTSSTLKHNNRDVMVNANQKFVCHSTAVSSANNCFVPLEYWWL